MRYILSIHAIVLLASANANTYTVSNINNSGAGSLRQAIISANGNAGVDTIDFDTAGVFATAQTITLNSVILISQGLIINAPSQVLRRVTLSANGAHSLLQFSTSSATLTLQNLTLNNAHGTQSGAVDFGGTTASLTLVAEGCDFTNNQSDGDGGAINLFGGTVNLTDCIFSNNTAGDQGGGVRAGTVTANNCNFDTTDAPFGAAIYATSIDLTNCGFDACVTSNTGILNYTTLSTKNCSLNGCTATAGTNASLLQGNTTTLRRTSLTNNAADFLLPYKAALTVTDVVTLESCTLSANTGGRPLSGSQTARFLNCTITSSGKLYGSRVRTVQQGVVMLDKDIVETVLLSMGNCASDHIYSLFRSLGGNVIARLDLLNSAPDATDDFGTFQAPLDLGLAALANNGAKGLTQRPNLGSPLIDHGLAHLISAPDYDAPFKDQTGRDRTEGTAADAGAVEMQQVYTVTNTNDVGAGSLRQTLVDAAQSLPAEIVFSDAVFGTGTGIITFFSQIDIATPVAIRGPEAGVKFNGGGITRLFNITSNTGTVEFQRIWLASGRQTNGSILSAVGANKSVVLRECRISEGYATGGGALNMESGQLRATNCLFQNNLADSNGGAVRIATGGTFHATNCTFTENLALQHGGAIAINASTARLIHCTVVGNTADNNADGAGEGGGIWRTGAASVVSVGNSIISGNLDLSPGANPVHPDVSGVFVSLGNNLLGKSEGLTAGSGTPFQNGVNGDVVGTIASPANPQLNVLASNGGLMKTIKPQGGSPCINAGSVTLLGDAAWLEFPDYDARYQFRDLGTAPDMGAVEATDFVYVKLRPVAGASIIDETGIAQGQLSLLRSMPGTALDVTVDLAGASTAEPEDFVLSASNLAVVNTTRWTAHFNADVRSKKLSFTAVNDALEDPAETAILTIALTGGYLFSTSPVAERTITIRDEDFIVTNANPGGAGSLTEKWDAAADCPQPAMVTFDPTFFSVPREIEFVALVQSTPSRITVQGPTTVGARVTLRRTAVISGIGGMLFFLERGEFTLRDLNITGGTEGAMHLATLGAPYVPRELIVNLERCTFHGNSNIYNGGAIRASTLAVVNITNCTFANNTCQGYGSAIAINLSDGYPDHIPYGFPGGVTLTHCTLVDNTCDTDFVGPITGGHTPFPGGALAHDSEDYSQWPEPPALPAFFVWRDVYVKDCIIARNLTGSPGNIRTSDVLGAMNSDGGNLIGNGNGAYDIEDGGNVSGGLTPNVGIVPAPWHTAAPGLDLRGNASVALDPLTLPLGSRGGTTLTCGLYGNSQARGLAADTSTLTTDQRGVARDATEDSGAFEFTTETYEFWRGYSFNGATLKTGPLEDFDGDGVVNLIERHSDTLPNSAASRPEILLVKNGSYWKVTWQRSLLVDPGSLKLYSSDNLQTWTEIPPGSNLGGGSLPTTTIPVGTQHELFTATLPPTTTNPKHQFARIKVTTP